MDNEALKHEWLVIDNTGKVLAGKPTELDATTVAKKFTLSGGRSYFIAQNKLKIGNARITISDELFV